MSGKRFAIVSGVLVLAAALSYLIAFGIIDFPGFAYFCDSDIYEDTLVARLMWEEKTLFPSGWCFGNQYYAVATPAAAALFYGITGRQNLAMGLASMLMVLLLLISFIFMVRPFVKNRLSLAVGGLALLAAVIAPGGASYSEAQHVFIQASYYACYLITAFVVFGDFMRARTSPRFKFSVSYVFALLLSFATGLQSLRQMAIMCLPLLAFLALEWLFGRRHASELLRALSYAAANLLGYLLSGVIAAPSESIIYTAGSVSLADKLKNAFHCATGISGLAYLSSGRYSLLLALPVLLFVLCSLWALVRTAKTLRKDPDDLPRLWTVFFISLLAAFAAYFVLDFELRSFYLFMYYPLAAISLMMLTERFADRSALIALILTAAAFINLGISYLPSVRVSLDPPYTEMHAMADRLKTEDAKYIYGKWTLATGIAAYSDGGLTAGCWDGELLVIRSSINPQNIYSEEDNRRAVYVIGTADHADFLAEAEKAGAELTLLFEGENGAKLYRSDRQLMRRSDMK